MFTEFISDLKSQLALDLPGVDAQFGMVPPKRPKPNFTEIAKTNPRIAGVLVLFYPVKNVPHLVLIKRHVYEGVHSGQIGFPGGQREDGDTDLIDTALRETHEELGIEKNSVHVLGQLSQVYIPPSRFLVHPFIGYLDQQPTFVPDPYEVNEILELPFDLFLKEKNKKQTTVQARQQTFHVPAYHVQNEIVWGATAMMLAELVALVKTIK